MSLASHTVQTLATSLASQDAANDINTATGKRLILNGGTAYANPDSAISISAGWGATASVTFTSGTDSRGSVFIHTAGGAQGVNPTFTIAFKDGGWPSGARPVAAVFPDQGNPTIAQLSYFFSGLTFTSLTIQFNGTPNNNSTYGFYWLIIG